MTAEATHVPVELNRIDAGGSLRGLGGLVAAELRRWFPWRALMLTVISSPSALMIVTRRGLTVAPVAMAWRTGQASLQTSGRSTSKHLRPMASSRGIPVIAAAAGLNAVMFWSWMPVLMSIDASSSGADEPSEEGSSTSPTFWAAATLKSPMFRL